jgi:hypothetical protein
MMLRSALSNAGVALAGYQAAQISQGSRRRVMSRLTGDGNDFVPSNEDDFEPLSG